MMDHPQSLVSGPFFPFQIFLFCILIFSGPRETVCLWKITADTISKYHWMNKTCNCLFSSSECLSEFFLSLMATGTPSWTTGVAIQIRLLTRSCYPEQRIVYWVTPSSSWLEMAAVNRLLLRKWALLAQRTVKIQRWGAGKGKQAVSSVVKTKPSNQHFKVPKVGFVVVSYSIFSTQTRTPHEAASVKSSCSAL